MKAPEHFKFANSENYMEIPFNLDQYSTYSDRSISLDQSNDSCYDYPSLFQEVIPLFHTSLKLMD